MALELKEKHVTMAILPTQMDVPATDSLSKQAGHAQEELQQPEILAQKFV